MQYGSLLFFLHLLIIYLLFSRRSQEEANRVAADIPGRFPLHIKKVAISKNRIHPLTGKSQSPDNSPENQQVSPSTYDILKALCEVIRMYIFSANMLLHVTRLCLLINITRMNSYFSLYNIFYLFYSLYYTNTKCFRKASFFLWLIPFTILLLFNKILNIPYVHITHNNDTSINLLKYHLLIFSLDSSINQFFENLITFLCFFTWALSLRLLPNNNNFQTTRIRNDTRSILIQGTESETLQNYPTIYLLFLYLFKHMDKSIVILLYYKGLESINIYHTFLIIYLILICLYESCARRHFIWMIILMHIRMLGKYLYVMIMQEVGGKDPPERVFKIIGLFTTCDINRILSKDNEPYEIFMFYYFGYIIYNCLLASNKFHSDDIVSLYSKLIEQILISSIKKHTQKFLY